MPAVIAKRRRRHRPFARKRLQRNRRDTSSQGQTLVLPPALRRRLEALHLPSPDDHQDITHPSMSQHAANELSLPASISEPAPRSESEEQRNNGGCEGVPSQEDVRVRELRACTGITGADAEASVDLGPFRSSQMSEGLASVLGSRISEERVGSAGKRVWRSLIDELEDATTENDSP